MCECIYEELSCCMSALWRSYECPECARERLIKTGLDDTEVEERMSVQFAHLTEEKVS